MSLQSDIKALIRSVGLELYDTAIVNENGETIYRVSVISTEKADDGKKKGVSLDQCVELTHLISPLLDVTPPVSGEYRLEVGSPGIERKVSTLEQFEMSLGENVVLGVVGKEKIRGVLKRVEGSKLYLEIDSEENVVDFDDIKSARTYFEW